MAVGRGHFTANCHSTQSFIITLSLVKLKELSLIDGLNQQYPNFQTIILFITNGNEHRSCYHPLSYPLRAFADFFVYVHCSTLQFLIKLAYLPSFSINGMAFCGFTPRYTQALKDRQVSSAATFFLDFSSDCTTSLICIYAITYLVCQNICEALDSIKFISWKCHFLICYLTQKAIFETKYSSNPLSVSLMIFL